MGVYEKIDWPLGDRVATPEDSYRLTKVEGQPYWGVRIESECNYMGGTFIFGHIIERFNEAGVPVLTDKFYAEKEPLPEPDRTAKLTILAIMG